MRAAESARRVARGRRHGIGARGSIATAAIALVALLVMAVCSGCLWLAIPSLVYRGYKAEERPNQSAQTKQNNNSQKSQSGGQYE
jgi:hypothetical protein